MYNAEYSIYKVDNVIFALSKKKPFFCFKIKINFNKTF